MADATLASPKRANILPTTDVLRLRVDDVDCSDSSFTSPPEDGQIVLAHGQAAVAGHTPKKADGTTDGGVYFKANNGSALHADLVRPRDASALAVCWSAGAQPINNQALGFKRVPVLRGAVRVKCKMFNLANGETIAGAYPAGTLVSAAKALVAVQGTSDRLVIDNMAETDCGWALGRVVGHPGTTATAGEGELEIQLFETPQFFVGKVN